MHPTGDTFMYIETSSNNDGQNVFFSPSKEQVLYKSTNKTFYYDRFSTLTNGSIKSMGRISIQLLIENNTWSTR